MPIELTKLDHLKQTLPRLDKVLDVDSVVADVVVIVFFFSFFKGMFTSLTDSILTPKGGGGIKNAQFLRNGILRR